MKLALIGHKISYSLSPMIHELISSDLLEYKIIDLPPEALVKQKPDALNNLNGFNVTIPHKLSVMSLCDQLDPLAEKIGAVNTVEIDQGKWKGYNTDYLGFMSALKESVKNYFDLHPVLVGYGGVARAVIFAIEEMGFQHISVIGGIDDIERREFINEINSVTKINVIDALPEMPCLWINGTPVGGAKCPEIPEDYMDFKNGDILFDLNYTPYPTHLEKYAQLKGIKTINGMKMLVYQAYEAQKIWFKNTLNPNVDVNAIIHSLRNMNTVS